MCTTDDSPAVLHEERAEGAAEGACPPQSAAAEERAHPDWATSPARVGTHDNLPPGAPETEDILASIFSAVARTADQGLQTDEHLHDDESLAAFMTSCRDGAPTAGQVTKSALRHLTQHREPTSCARDPASASHQAHLRRNYAALRLAAESHATTAGDGHAEGQPEEVSSQRQRAQDAPAHGVWGAAATGTVSEPVEGIPPRMTQPWGHRTMHNPKGTHSAPLSRRTAQLPLTWTGGSPGSPTWSSSPSRSEHGGSSWTYTKSGTAPAPWQTFYLTSVKGNTPRLPPLNIPASCGMCPPASRPT